MSKSTRFYGFTLVEVLVVIAIIGVLVAILLPAVQVARESANRMSCGNNMKQIGLAFQNYHDAFDSFPIGNRYIWEYGTNWRFSILPFMERKTIYDKSPATGYFTSQYYHYGETNNLHLKDLVVPEYRCPSSAAPVDGFVGWPSPPPYNNNSGNGQLIDYVGISGADPESGFDSSEQCHVSSFYGTACYNGLLTIGETFDIASITDGTSNTIIVAEQSGLVSTPSGPKDLRSNYLGGWSGTETRNKVSDYTSPWSPIYGTGINTVKYSINYKSTSSFLPSGMAEIRRPNAPLNSFHAAGVQTVRADGSVHYISETIKIITLKKLASKNDGLVIDEQ